MERSLSDYNQPELFEAEGELPEEAFDLLEEKSGIPILRSVGMINGPFRAKSRFSIGEPVVLPLAKLLSAHKNKLPADIGLQMRQYEFYQVQLACSFEAASNCRFHDARFALALETISTNPTEAVPGNAIAYDLFPLKFEEEYKVSVKRSLNPEIKFSFDPFSSSLALPLFERTEEYATYSSRIEAFDLQGTEPAWRFSRTTSHEIGGSQKLFMIVRKPKGTQVRAIFTLSASVNFVLGNMVLDPFPLLFLFRRSGASSTLSDAPSYPLC